MLGTLLFSASGATTVDGNTRQHSKIDNTRYTYFGRSFGVGASVGLLDSTIGRDALALGYSYEEQGYRADVNCMYNSSSDFVISESSRPIYTASGDTPDQNGDEETSAYVGHYSSAIVAIGVSHTNASPRRFLSIAAGDSHAALNATQCSVDFIPTLYSVSVSLSGRNISVTPIAPTTDIDPTKNLTRTLMRQYELISNDETNLYFSIVGNAFNASIADYNTSRAGDASLTEREATLAGLTNSITPMADDMLVAYASAQLMVGNLRQATNATVEISAIRFGESAYVKAIFAVNLAVLLIIGVEASRTRSWKGLTSFDYLDPRRLVVASSTGGNGIARTAIVARRTSMIKGKGSCFEEPEATIGDLPVKLVTEGEFAIVADPRAYGRKAESGTLLYGVS